MLVNRLLSLCLAVVVLWGVVFVAPPVLAAGSCVGLEVGDTCGGDPTYVCKGPYGAVTCQCRWGDFENIYPGVSLCSFASSYSGGNDTRGGIIDILGLLITGLTALVIMTAMVSMLVGGYIYMTAGGSADRVKVAKTWIVAALLGIVIALSAWIILRAINPFLLGG